MAPVKTFVALLLLSLAPVAFAQEADGMDASWARATSGGEVSSAGDFEVYGAIASPEADPDVANGDSFVLRGGFFVEMPVAGEAAPDRVFLDDFE